MNELIQRLQARSLGLTATDQAQFVSLIRPAVGMKDTLVDDAAVAVGQSKIGGRPDLPSSFEWPTYNNEPLTFCAQYNLAEAAPFDLEHLLPKQGLLSVFIYVDKSVPEFISTRGSFRLVYSAEITSLKRTDFPASYPPGSIFRAARFSYFHYYTVPDVESYKLKGFDTARLKAFGQFKLAVEEIADDLSGYRNPQFPQFPARNMHQLVGEDRSVQASAILYFAWDLLGLNSATRDERKANQDKIEALKREYIILLQLDTCSSKSNDLDRYGECAVIYVGIKPEDLKNQRFDRMVMTIQGT